MSVSNLGNRMFCSFKILIIRVQRIQYKYKSKKYKINLLPQFILKRFCSIKKLYFQYLYEKTSNLLKNFRIFQFLNALYFYSFKYLQLFHCIYWSETLPEPFLDQLGVLNVDEIW